MQKRLVDLTKSDSLNNSDYLFINHDDNPIQISLPYFKQNVAPVDATLTEEGKAADAKTTGDKIDEINTNIETINTEIEGVKTNYATKEELNAVSTSLTETQENIAELSSGIESVKTNYLAKSDAQSIYLTKEDASTISDKEFYEGRKYDGMTYTGKTSDKGVQLVKVIGKTTQQTTKGYQLFDQSKLPTKTQGGATVTNNGDGSFTVSGSGELTENFSQNIYYSKEETLNLLKQGTLKANGLGNISPNILFGLRNKNTGTFVSGKSVNKNTNSCQITQNDLDTLGDEIVLSISMYTAQGTQIVNGTIKPMIYIDGDGVYEPFTGAKPAPNPDYAMPIQNVEINKIVSHSRNLFDQSKIGNHSEGGATLTNNGDGSFTVSGSGTVSELFVINSDITGENAKALFKTGRYKTALSDVKPYFYFSFRHSDGIYGDVDSNSHPTFDLTDEMINSDGFYVRYGFQLPQGNQIVAGSIKPMVYMTGDGTWEEFKLDTVETNLTLAQDDVYENNKITRARKQVVFDGSSDENWRREETSKNNIYRFMIYNAFKVSNNIWLKKDKQVCNRLPVGDTWENPKGDCFSIDDEGNMTVYIDSLKNSTLEEFKTWIQSHPLTVEYELETPTTEEFKIPTVQSYFDYTEVSTNSELQTDMTWKVLADCDNSLANEALEKRILALETKAIE